ncbi:MAG: DUF2200 family protein, partial [Nocardioidaceae bacterium]
MLTRCVAWPTPPVRPGTSPRAGFFADARLNPQASLITGVVYGVRVENVDDPLMQKICYLVKLVDE